MSVPVVPYGAWPSPITTELLIAGTVGLDDVRCDGADLYWLERRPSEQGRVVLVRRSADGTVRDLTPPPFNVRTRVHEYGGGAYTVAQGRVWFCNFQDSRVYAIEPGAPIRPLTAADGRRYADFTVDPLHNRLVAVCEDHRQGDGEPVNSIVAIALDTGDVTTLAQGDDFYAAPRVSPEGGRLAWVSWNHPDMPWDQSTLRVADLAGDGSLAEPVAVAGGTGRAAGFPRWLADGSLVFVDDPDGWWNLFRRADVEITPLAPIAAEFGRPMWTLGREEVEPLADGRLLVQFVEQGTTRFGTVSAGGGDLRRLDLPYTDIVAAAAAPDGGVYVVAETVDRLAVLAHVDLETRAETILRRSTGNDLDPAVISTAEAIRFPTGDGGEAHAFYYPPRNPAVGAPSGEKPPLLVRCHGGPTSATKSGLNLTHQYYTSRGIAVVDVNYRGSTGFGRAYREALHGRWGEVDIIDCCAAVDWLVAQGRVDGDRVAISGGSAGGYTVLAALAFRNTFRVGASHFGISDLSLLAAETHKFESRYLDRLVAPPDRQDVYRARSPIHHLEGFSCPVIFFQGGEDHVVPPNQAERMVDALEKRGIPVAYVLFPEEGHGFRDGANIKRALEGQLWFFGEVLGFDPADPIDPLEIRGRP